MTLVDTVAWSLVFRRAGSVRTANEQRVFDEMNQLVLSGNAVLIGPIRQELLSGVRSFEQFARLRRMIAPFAMLPLHAHSYDCAAEFANLCRGNGIAAGDIDMMVCSAAVEHNASILTLDADFVRYAAVLPIRLA